MPQENCVEGWGPLDFILGQNENQMKDVRTSFWLIVFCFLCCLRSLLFLTVLLGEFPGALLSFRGQEGEDTILDVH